METTLLPDQYVLVDKLTPRFDSYSRGDIVVFNPVIRDGPCTNPVEDPDNPPETPFIKRVIGEPGDTIELRNGDVFVNGVLLDEPYVHGASTSPLSGESAWTVEPDRLFLMGDNRDNSTDSRSDEIGDGLRQRCHRPRLAALLADQHGRHPADPDLPGDAARHRRSPRRDLHALSQGWRPSADINVVVRFPADWRFGALLGAV